MEKLLLAVNDVVCKSETIYLNNKKQCKPFLKWAGGKTQLLPELKKYVPVSYNKYIEPFIGGGAFYFSLNPSKAIIADLNYELVLTYKTIRESLDDVIKLLSTYINDKDFYYAIRAIDPNSLTSVERAARLIYLNKTCFNGLYRVNKQGGFNVPFGKGTGRICNEDILGNVSNYLQDTEIIHDNYINTLGKYAEEGDFIFLDPPYYPVGESSDFKRYTKESFYHDDHIQLKNEFDRLVNMGCNVLLTNSNHPVIMDLYSNYEIKSIDTKRMINSNAKNRKGVDIIVIGNK